VNDQASNWVRFAPGNPVLKGVNWGGLRTLYIKEVRRFFKVQMQTVWAPAITQLLYLVIFTVALGRGGRTVVVAPGVDVPFVNFLAPGLIVMAMIQNAFANSSFSLLVGKIQGNIVDYLMPPLSTGELIAGLVGASVTRAFFVGFALWFVMLFWPGVSVAVRRPELLIYFGLMGSLIMSFLGLLTSIWADKFDHAAAVTNFVVTPLALLSGTFYSVHQLAPAVQRICYANPIFYVISGFRAGFLGVSDSPLWVGGIALLALNFVLWGICYSVLKSGWKIKN
jgi:ABC-2 type transport system permease protein